LIDEKKYCIAIATEYFFEEKQRKKKRFIFTNFGGGLVLTGGLNFGEY